MENSQNWKAGEVIRRFQLYEHDYVSCVFWENQHYITGTDIVKAITFRFKIQGHEIKNVKKFEEGIFSDLRNLKPGIDSSLEEPKSPFLELLYKNKCIRTQKKQKVFFWYSVPYDRLYQDVLKRDKKRELNGKKSNIVIDKSRSPSIKRENSKSVESTTSHINMFKGEMEMNKNSQNSNIVYSKWVDETQKLSNSSHGHNKTNHNDIKVKKEIDIKIKKEEPSTSPQLKKIKKGRKYIITKYFAKGAINNCNSSSLKFVCDKKDCNKKFKKLEELVKHKKYVHGADKIGYNYSKDFMYVEKNLSADKNDKSQFLLSPSLANAPGNTSYIISPLELEDENNNWSIIIAPDSSMSSSDESMVTGNVSTSDPGNFSLNDYSLSNISNPNESISMNLDLKNLSSMSLLNVNTQGSSLNGKTSKGKNHRLSVSSNTTLNNINNSNILSTSTISTPDLTDTSMNTTFLSNQTFTNNSSFIIQSNDNQDILLISPVLSSTIQSHPLNQGVSVSNNNIPNVNDVTIPTAHFMAIDSPIQHDGNGTSFLQNISVPSQNTTQYITTDQCSNITASVQYVPSILDGSTATTSGSFISYELSSMMNQVTNPPVNVYVTSKVSPDPMNYISSPTPLEYQQMNQPQPQPHTPTSTFTPNSQQPQPQPQQAMFYTLPSEANPNSIGQTYIHPQTQYIQVPTQSQQQIYIPHENVQNIVQMSYQ
ncbi:STE-domain-containing protein [Neocallimastix lanati (nom. inval.)]|uniref:STE-domain-containing protein n=1 Tax=Neocallimastix californiae TaxID=1754190 RepID=A0A1Y2F304_9FUNG|nr:STE-domain-containing protein [Neocallimastix sp. JGI-2020a]ORY78270.1 STE-domain-containing protein [Neocallimastix californiae]|eukprot:ORY78270.1 STE-domain-containing protein [Neocallimastix californiae]